MGIFSLELLFNTKQKLMCFLVSWYLLPSSGRYLYCMPGKRHYFTALFMVVVTVKIPIVFIRKQVSDEKTTMSFSGNGVKLQSIKSLLFHFIDV